MYKYRKSLSTRTDSNVLENRKCLNNDALLILDVFRSIMLLLPFNLYLGHEFKVN